ncbi:phage holin family protein [Clostridium perfringens]|uniref:phage holin family protein n=1 Tax=Clostridium perfringens TaxID=1502 RepID=UPI001ABA8A76|nr:phage holin family protein [Clostridium perfringens]MBO3395109.1 phage holin family protein [Clostridium perfringens]MBO3400923.1 phage holin family protein [Clostridium perfringens]MCX0373150.1 phage holin family protein [Clostridium perfringens]MDK0531428.1 phage holin family protein [Clostridium perfringens]MDM0640068.1 phage holin family protein [Clostridium perfringens]
MENIFDYLKIGIVATGTLFTWLLGAWDTPLVILIVLMALDYITGITKAYVNKDLSSNIGLKGIARKGVIFTILIVAVMLDRLLNTGNWIFRTLVCYFYIANEGISIIENASELGVPVPSKLKNALIQLKEDKEDHKKL